MSIGIDTKPKITKDQIVKSSIISKRLGQYRGGANIVGLSILKF